MFETNFKSIIITPVELVKTQLQVQTNNLKISEYVTFNQLIATVNHRVTKSRLTVNLGQKWRRTIMPYFQNGICQENIQPTWNGWNLSWCRCNHLS